MLAVVGVRRHIGAMDNPTAPSRAKLLHTAEQFAAVIGDFMPVLVPMLARHCDSLEAQGFTRGEAVRMTAGLQNTIVSTIMRAASTSGRKE